MNQIDTLNKLKKIIKSGYIPCRFNESYTRETSILANCFSHSCFNFTNDILSSQFTFDDVNIMGLLDGNGKDNSVEVLMDFVCKTGLHVSQCKINENTNWNQWKVSVYFTDVYNTFCGDYHLIKQEKDFSWSSKNGFYENVDFLYNVFNKVTCNNHNYLYHSFCN